MANQIVNRQVNVFINSGDAQKAFDKLIAKEKLFKDELAKATDPKKIANLNKELAKLAEPIDRATKKLNGELAPSFRDLQAGAARAIAEFKKTGDPALLSQYAKFNAELQKQKDLINGVNTAQQGLTKGGIFSTVFWANLAAKGIELAGTALHDFFGSAIDEALQADKANIQLQSTLENLGRTDAFDRLVRKAQEVADRFTFLDNDEVVGVFNKLIDFGKLTETQMNDLIPVIVNFAAKTRQDLGSATEVILNALEGNGRALKQFGINIKDAGTEGERLNIIMTTLKDKVDGAGDAFAKSAAGGIASAKQQFKDLKEEVGNQLIPIMNKLLSVFSQGLKNLKTFGNALKEALNGGTGFFAINKDAITQDPNFKATVDQLVEQRVNAFDAAQKNIEQQIGRKLTGSKADQELLKNSQEAIKKGFLNQIQSAQQRIDALKKNFDNSVSQGQELRALLESINASQGALDQLNSRGEKTLGISTPGKADTAEADKLLEDFKKLAEELQKLKGQDINASAIDKEVVALDEKFNELKKLAHGNRQKLIEIDQAYYQELFEIQLKYARLETEAIEKQEKEKEKRIREFNDSIVKDVTDASNEVLKRNTQILTAVFDSVNRSNIAGLQLRVLQTTGKQRLQAQLKLLDEEEKQELQKKGLTENEKLLIEEQYRKKRKEAEQQHLAGILDITIGFAQQALQIFTAFADARTQTENADLEADRSRNETKKRNLDRQLKGKLLTQLQYQREIDKIDREQDKKERETKRKQFNRNKISSLASIAINGAQGISKTIAELGFPAAIPFLIAQGAVILAQLIAVGTQKTPEFAKGGKLGGMSHAQGGNPILDGSGRKIAEIEAGEGIINKNTMRDNRSYTVSGTPSQIASSINRLHGGVAWDSGATLSPQWRNIQPQRMNFSAMKKAYAGGGVFNSDNNSQAPTAVDLTELTQVIADMRSTLAEIQQKGIWAKTLITDQEKQQDRINSIRNDATIKG